MKSGEIQAVPSYLGDYYLSVLNYKLQSNLDPNEMYGHIEEDLHEYGVQAVGQLGPDNIYVFAVKPELARKYSLSKVSDLKEIASQLKIGVSPNFYSRDQDGLNGVCAAYDMQFKEAYTFSVAPMYVALETDEVDVIVTFATDGLLQKYDLVFLEDDLEFFPPNVLFMMLNEELVEKHPELYDACRKLEMMVTDEEMQAMNFRVAEQEEEPATIAHEYLVSHGLLPE